MVSMKKPRMGKYSSSIGVREEKVTQKGAEPRKEIRTTSARRPRKNLKDPYFHPVAE
jgi:hypothetical protein